MKPREPLEQKLKLGMKSTEPLEPLEPLEQKLLGFASMKCP